VKTGNLDLYIKRAKSYPLRTSQPDLKDIVKELKTLGGKIDKLEKIVESRLVGEAKPDEYERKAITEFEKKRKYGKLEFTPF
jgi:hypothetical protein